MIQAVKNFINYWYFRYLLVTELYMVEKWERAMFHIVMLVILSVLYLFNITVILGLVKIFTNTGRHGDLKVEDNLILKAVPNV
uniref:Serine palmitoyltransferase small subunit A n=1 Tax=Diabrotica virgifera virgifera TaxID=50390 RepID=A0A6P7HF86_DIAVI